MAYRWTWSVQLQQAGQSAVGAATAHFTTLLGPCSAADSLRAASGLVTGDNPAYAGRGQTFAYTSERCCWLLGGEPCSSR